MHAFFILLILSAVFLKANGQSRIGTFTNSYKESANNLVFIEDISIHSSLEAAPVDLYAQIENALTTGSYTSTGSEGFASSGAIENAGEKTSF